MKLTALVSRVRVAWQAFKTRRKMNRQFGRRQDPFSYETSRYEVARLAAMDAVLDAKSGESILELGCAEGHFTVRLLERKARVTAVDISATALARASRRAPGAVFVEADLLSWNPEKSFDALIVSDVLYYLDRPIVAAEFARFFSRARSWLKPSGRLLLVHGFAGQKELAHRRSFRERFEVAGLTLVKEDVLAAARGDVKCLLSLLRNSGEMS